MPMKNEGGIPPYLTQINAVAFVKLSDIRSNAVQSWVGVNVDETLARLHA
jgi:hypothetical protein